MKKYLSAVLILFAFTTTLTSCTKEKQTALTAKNYEPAIKEKTWWGVLTYAGETSQYYTVHFNADNTIMWSQLSGDYAGQWRPIDRTVFITIAGINARIQAEISIDDNLVNITDNLANLEINNGKLLSAAAIDLERTVWQGSGLAGAGTSNNIQISFLANRRAEIKLNNTVYPSYPYETSVSGNAFRIHTPGGFQYFGVTVSATDVKGSAQFTQYPFQLARH